MPSHHSAPLIDHCSLFHFLPPFLLYFFLVLFSSFLFFPDVYFVLSILKTIGRRCFVLKIPGWESADFVCEFTNQYLKKAEASAVNAALLSLWITICAEGSKCTAASEQKLNERTNNQTFATKQEIQKRK